MARHLLIRLQSPLQAFGGETIDNLGVIRDFPALSMLTGLLANALGWDRCDDEAHNRLQARLRMGTRLDGEGRRLTDFQTARLDASDAGWTTTGQPEVRQGGANTYKGPHLRYRDYHAGLDALTAIRLEPEEESPTLDMLAAALDKPARPLFIGRKPCLPMSRLMAGWVEADSILQALQRALPPVRTPVRAQWPEGEGRLEAGERVLDICDERNWTSGVHGGWRPVCEGVLHSLEVPA